MAVAGVRLAAGIGHAGPPVVGVARQAVAAFGHSLVVVTDPVLIGAVTVVDAGIGRPALPVSVVRESVVAKLAAVPGVSGIAAATDGSTGIITGAVLVAGIDLAFLDDDLAVVVDTLLTGRTVGILPARVAFAVQTDTAWAIRIGFAVFSRLRAATPDQENRQRQDKNSPCPGNAH
jgi:hypothetical protein